MGRRIKLIQGIVIMLICPGVNKYVFAEEDAPKEMIECAMPDGEAGYYITKPTVYVHHMEESGTTKILFLKPNGEQVEEVLGDGDKNSLCIDETWFQEGKHVLQVWRESEMGEEIEESRMVKEFLIDTKQPEPVEFSYEKEEGEVLCFSDSTFVKLMVRDEGAGIKELCYQLEGSEEVRTETDHLTIEIPINYSGNITAWAVDAAGNKSIGEDSKYIMVENQSPEIQFISGENLEVYHNKEVTITIGIKEEGVISGIAGVRCYVNGKLKQEKINPLPFIPRESFSIVVKDTAEVVVETEDYAGNITSAKQEVLVDREMPKIEVGGICDRMITGETVSISCVAEDNQKLQSAELTVLWENEAEQEILLECGEWKRGEMGWTIEKQIEEDGIYYIEVRAVDMAGNICMQKFQIVIDKTNPVIRYVEDLQGKYLKKFQWEYGLTDMIWDFTNYTYEIRLDGKLRNMRITEKKEGKHIFSVRVTDAAGNVSEARAEFVIDHTEPNIIFEGIENGGCYEEPVDIKILTEQESDQITDILINGERQEQNRVDGSFGFMFEKVGKYELFVKAEDLAGNVSDKKLSFEIRQKPKNILEKIFYQKGEGRKGDIRAREKAEKQGLYLAGGLAGIAIVCLGIGYKKKKAH